MNTIGIIFLLFITGVISFITGYILHHKHQRKIDLECLEQARRELGGIKKTGEFNFFPGTFQYRPIISGYRSNCIDTIFYWYTEEDFGIGGAYTRDGKYTIDEYPLVINHSEIDPDMFVKLGSAIKDIGEKLKEKRS